MSERVRKSRKPQEVLLEGDLITINPSDLVPMKRLGKIVLKDDDDWYVVQVDGLRDNLIWVNLKATR